MLSAMWRTLEVNSLSQLMETKPRPSARPHSAKSLHRCNRRVHSWQWVVQKATRVTALAS